MENRRKIVVHTYSLNGYHIAVDGNSGSVHVLDDLIYQIVQDEKDLPELDQVIKQLQDQYQEEEISQAYDEIKQLIAAGLLYRPIADIEKAVTAEKINTNLKAL